MGYIGVGSITEDEAVKDHTKSCCYLIQEFMDGGTLKQKVWRQVGRCSPCHRRTVLHTSLQLPVHEWKNKHRTQNKITHFKFQKHTFQFENPTLLKFQKHRFQIPKTHNNAACSQACLPRSTASMTRWNGAGRLPRAWRTCILQTQW